jgi:hypothetical protein
MNIPSLITAADAVRDSANKIPPVFMIADLTDRDSD